MTTQDVVSYITAVISIASIAAAVLPPGGPNTIWGKIRMVIDAIAMNWGNAKNKVI